MEVSTEETPSITVSFFVTSFFVTSLFLYLFIRKLILWFLSLAEFPPNCYANCFGKPMPDDITNFINNTNKIETNKKSKGEY